MKKRMIRCALMVSSLWFFCGCRSLFPLNDDPVVTHSASEDYANVFSEENVVNPVEVPEGVSMYCSSPVNVRSLPGMEGEVIGSLEENERVTVTGNEGGWYAIPYDGGSGYVYQDYLAGDSQQEE